MSHSFSLFMEINSLTFYILFAICIHKYLRSIFILSFLLFCREFEQQVCKFKSYGAIHNKNKIEDFKSCDKVALINEEGKLLWDDISSGRCLDNPHLLARFLILAFAVSKIYADLGSIRMVNGTSFGTQPIFDTIS